MFKFLEKKAPLINIITHKELQIIYGLTHSGAAKRLAGIRSSLGKTSDHKLTVIDFCKAEDISIQDFDLMIKRAYGIFE